MNAEIEIIGIGDAEKAALEILEHVEAIRKIQRGVAWNAVGSKIIINGKETASGN